MPFRVEITSTATHPMAQAKANTTAGGQMSMRPTNATMSPAAGVATTMAGDTHCMTVRADRKSVV